jgi:hypothetical protein
VKAVVSLATNSFKAWVYFGRVMEPEESRMISKSFVMLQGTIGYSGSLVVVGVGVVVVVVVGVGVVVVVVVVGVGVVVVVVVVGGSGLESVF